jgi:predicted chitinase
MRKSSKRMTVTVIALLSFVAAFAVAITAIYAVGSPTGTNKPTDTRLIVSGFIKDERPIPAAKAAVPVPNVSGTDLEAILKRAAKAAGIRGNELAAFLSQCAHETMNFVSLVEIGSPQYFRRYDPAHAPRQARSLGNTEAGDGERYKGRGYIQLTGRYNYRRAGEALGLPLEAYPELAEQPHIAAKIAIWYWEWRVRPAVNNFADVRAVTRPINPGLNGLPDRREKFQTYQVALL